MVFRQMWHEKGAGCASSVRFRASRGADENLVWGRARRSLAADRHALRGLPRLGGRGRWPGGYSPAWDTNFVFRYASIASDPPSDP